MYIVHKCKRAETESMLLGKIKGQSTYIWSWKGALGLIDIHKRRNWTVH